MRSQYGIEWIGDDSAGYSAFAEVAREIGVDVSGSDSDSAEKQSSIRAMSVRGRMQLDHLQALKSKLDHPSAGKLVVVDENDTYGIATASAIDCDDILILPTCHDILKRRLDTLFELSCLRAEWHLRERIVESLFGARSQNPIRQPSLRERHLKVVMIGAIGSAAARLTDMLQPASIVFSDDRKFIADCRQDQNVDLLISAVAPNEADRAATMKPVHARWIWLSDQEEDRLRRRSTDYRGVRLDDRIEANMPSELLRVRLRIQRRLATIGRSLSCLSFDARLGDIRDTESGCFGTTFAQAYLAERTQDTAREFVTLDFAPTDMPSLIERLGFRGLSEWFASTAKNLGQVIRADDLICHLGEGQFRVFLQNCTPQDAGRVAIRLVDASDRTLRCRQSDSAFSCSLGRRGNPLMDKRLDRSFA